VTLTGALFTHLGISSPLATTSSTAAATSAPTANTASSLSTASAITTAARPDVLLTGSATAPAAAGWGVARLLSVLRIARLPLVVATAGAVLTTSVILWKDDPDASSTLPKDTPVTVGRSADGPASDDVAFTDGKPSTPAADVVGGSMGNNEEQDDLARTDAARTDVALTDAAKESGRAATDRTDKTSGSDMLRERAVDPSAAVPPAPPMQTASVPQPGVIPPSSADTAPDAAEVRALEAMDLPVLATPAPQMDTSVVAPIGMQPRISGVRLPRGFTLAFTGLAKSSAPVVDLPSASDPLFNRMSISLGYMLDASSHIGLTFGQEAFPQRFNGREERIAVRYEQNLLTPWAAAWYRHSFGALLFEDLHPWAEISAGSTREFWPLMRGGVGLAYDLHPLLRLQAGVDLGVLGYRFQDRWFTTRHLGVSYGLMLRF
jgi:hypothetical protein